MGKQTMFFATRNDLLRGAERLEAKHRLKYVSRDVLSMLTTDCPTSLSELPHLGLSLTGDNVHDNRYLVVHQDTGVIIRAIEQRRGGFNYALDQPENPSSIVFQPGGLYKESCLIAGSISTISKEQSSLDLYRIFVREITRGFHKVDDLRVGMEAMELLNSKKVRLTTSFRSPVEYDLKCETPSVVDHHPKRAFTIWELLVVLLILVILAALLFPLFARPKGDGGRSSCQSNLKLMGLAIRQYAQDYDEKYPLVNSGTDGWVDLIQPYVKSTRLFQCPSEDSKQTEEGTTDYFYNARLAGQEQRKLKYVANTLMNGDGAGDWPSNASIVRLPKEWTQEDTSPARRHLDGANYVYADGHVKWLKPASVTNKPAAPNISTFAPW